MNKYILSLFLLLPIASFSQWQTLYFPVPGYDTLSDIISISFSDVKNGFSAGHGNNYYPHAGVISVTNDSGINWTPSLKVDSFLFTKIKHVNPTKVIATGGNYNLSIPTIRGILAKTSNSGSSWDTTRFGFNLESIAIINDSVYIIEGRDYSTTSRDSRLIKTSDGGVSWNEIPFSYPNKRISDISFIDDSVGIMTIFDKNILKTVNQGLNWDTVQVDTISNLVIHSISSISDSTFYVLAEQGYTLGNYLVYKSSDKGDTWSLQSSIPNWLFLTDIEFATDNVGYITGQFTMLKTVDGGITWNSQYASYPGYKNFYDWVEKICIISADTVYAAGRKQFYRTFNGGDTILTTSISKADLNRSYKAYPNPTSNQFYIESKEQLNLTFQLFNVLGIEQKIEFQQSYYRYEFSLAHLPKGIYLLNVIAEDEQSSIKLLKE